MYVRGYLQGSENGRVVTIEWYVYHIKQLCMVSERAYDALDRGFEPG
jgi:hypothetical protein